MTQQTRIILDQDGTGADFDAALQGTLQDYGNAVFISKANGTESGLPAVLIGFTVRLPDGTDRRVQTVVTGRILVAVAQALCGANPSLGRPPLLGAKPGESRHGIHAGVGWDAICVEKCWLITTEKSDRVGFAFEDAEVESVARGIIDA